MEISVYLDLNMEYLAKCRGDFKLMENVVERVESPEMLVVLSDDVDAATKWEGYAVIGIEHENRIGQISYVTDSLVNVDGEFVELAYCRKFSLPVTIKETGRLIIREMCLEDVEKICDLYEDKENVRFLPSINGYAKEVELAKAYIENMYGVYGYGLWVVTLKDSGRVIGRAGIEHRNIGDKIYHELGYMLAREYQGQGLAYEAAGAVLEFACEYGIEEIIAYIHEKNTPSVNLATRLGACEVERINDGAEKFILFRF